MGETRRCLPALALGILALLVHPAAARELGDFGRVKPGFVNEELFPAIESGLKRARGEPASNFNWTDQESEMHDRVWRFLVDPRASGWTFDELKARGYRAPTDRYYRWLKHERYASSRIRYNSLAADVGADLGTLDGVFRSICAVREVDRQRGVAATGLDALEADVLANQRARTAENQWHIDRFVSALDYRYAAYSYALDHLLVETPHEEALAADGRLSELAAWVDRADAGDFCGGAGAWAGAAGAAIPGRTLRGVPSEGEFRK